MTNQNYVLKDSTKSFKNMLSQAEYDYKEICSWYSLRKIKIQTQIKVRIRITLRFRIRAKIRIVGLSSV